MNLPELPLSRALHRTLHALRLSIIGQFEIINDLSAQTILLALLGRAFRGGLDA
jgi:hypothetical protein